MHILYSMAMSVLKRFRLANQLTQAQLARRLAVSESLIAQIERGRRQITAERAVRWHRATDGALRLEEMRPDLWPRHADSPPERGTRPSGAA
jgi:DNA-binding transcriptional regulator YdaS (Cro superfamily)